MASVIAGIKYLEGRLSELNTAAQAMITHLMLINNRQGNSGWVEVSDRDLRELTRVKSNETITRGKRELQDKGFIGYETAGTKTRYELKFYTGSAPVQSVRQSVHVSVQEDNFLLTRARKTLEQPPQPPQPGLDDLTISDELDETIDSWRDDPQMPVLYIEQESRLRERIRQGESTLEQFKRALTKAKESNSPDGHGHRGLCFAYVWKNWDRIIAADKKKVATSVERRVDKKSVRKEVKAASAWYPALRNPVDEKSELRNPVDEKSELRNPVDVSNPALRNPVDEKSELRNPVDEKSELRNPVDEKSELRNPVDEKSELRNPVDEKSELRNPVDVSKPALANAVDEKSALRKPLTASERQRAAQIKEMLKSYRVPLPSKRVEEPTERPLVDKATMASYVAEMRAKFKGVIADARKAG